MQHKAQTTDRDNQSDADTALESGPSNLVRNQVSDQQILNTL